MKNITKTLKYTKLGVIAGGAALLSVNSANAALEEEIGKIFDEGKVSLNVRARYEKTTAAAGRTVAGERDAFSIRTRLGYSTAAYHGFKAMIEMEDLSLLDDDHRHFLDPATTELNQLFLNYTAEDFAAKVGRQVFTLDDHRFIGHVGWRQNIQSFDAITASTTIIPKAKLTLGYLSKVNRINATSQDLDGILANLSYKPADYLNITAFSYLLDFDTVRAWSADTYGLRATGKFKMDDVSFSYAASYATQSDNSGSPTGTSFDLDYYSFDLGTSFYGVSLGIGAEVLEGNGTRGFVTPLATVHKFNGWADVFAGPSLGGGLTDGLEDYYVSAGYKIPVGKGIPFKVIYHKFEAENIGQDIGTELDFVVSYKINKYLTVLGKYADYSTDNPVGIGYGTSDQDMYSLELNFKY